MKKIHSLHIDISDIPAVETVRNISISADVGAKFTMIIIESGTLKYYDFIDKTFEAGHNNINNNLNITMASKRFVHNITFPAGGATYIIKLIANEDTEISGHSNKKIITKSITQIGTDPTVTFTFATANTNNYSTFPTTQKQGSGASHDKFDINWTATNPTNDSYGFGLRFKDATDDSFTGADWYCTTTDTVDGAVTSSTTVVVDDLTGIGIGSLVTGVSSGSLSGTPSITGIDTTTKTLTLSSEQTFADGITLTFKAYGAKAIFYATGAKFTFETGTMNFSRYTKNIRSGSSGTTINLNNTHGIAGGNHVTISGIGIDNSSANAVTSVTADADGSGTDGAIVVQLSQSGLTVGSSISFKGSYPTIDFSSSISINNYPTSNLSVYLDLDRLITVGAAS